MYLTKSDTLGIRVHPVLKAKFSIAIWFLDFSSVFNDFMQDYVREFELKHGVIPVKVNKETQYEIVTKLLWNKINKNLFEEISQDMQYKIITEDIGIQITRERYDELISHYPKTKKNITLYGD